MSFKDSTFDYVFIRHLSFGFTEQDWKDVINEILRLTKPGGWIEVCHMRADPFVFQIKN